MTRVLLFVLLMVLHPVAADALGIGLPDPPYVGLDAAVRAARIDSLEALYPGTTGPVRARMACRLGDLYASKDRIEDRVVAQDYFEEATRLEPTFEPAVAASAVEYARAGFHDLARRRAEALVGLEPGAVGPLLLLARMEFVAACRNTRDVDPAYQLYVTALGAAPDDPEALEGAAVSALLVENFELAASCARRWRALQPGSADPWLVGGAAEFRRGNPDEGWWDFLRGLENSPPDVREAFLGESVLLTDEILAQLARRVVDPVRAREVLGLGPGDRSIDWRTLVRDPAIREEVVEDWWMRRDESPAEFENESQLEYWSRLVEADLKFGRVEQGIHGWESLPGEVWVRMGRPVSQLYFTTGSEADARNQLPPGLDTTMADEYRLTGSLLLEPIKRLWNWQYRIDGRPVTVLFQDNTYGEPLWAVCPASPTDLGVLRTEIAFVEPSRARPPDEFQLAVSVAHFTRAPESIIETVISTRHVLPADSVSAARRPIRVEWTLSDAQDHPLDEVVRTVGEDRHLSRLVAASGQAVTAMRSDPRLALVGARVPPGRYHIRVRALDTHTGRFSAKTLAVDVPRPAPDDELALSSVQLCHGLPEWDPHGDFPAEFVKHGRAVIHAPSAVIEGDVLGVFYELENLARGPDGRTRFDVEYAIYRGSGDVRLRAMLGSSDLAGLEEVDPVTVQYLEERTGVSPEGVVVKGTELDVSSLPEGDYVLRIRVEDRLVARTCSAVAAFRRLPPVGRL